MTGVEDRLDELEAHLDDHLKRLAEHERALAAAREGLAERETAGSTDSPPGTGAATGGLLAALGLVAGTGTVGADPQGQLGTGPNPVDAVHTAALDGSVTGSQRIDSLVGDNLAIEDGTLTLDGGN